MDYRRIVAGAFLTIFLVGAGACAGGAPRGAPVYDPRALPTGPVGKSIAYGHDIIVDTQHVMKGYVRAQMSCEACHLDAGTKPKGGSFIGVYGQFPQWNERSHRVIALQDRLAECFLYSMNGKPPVYTSKAMIALVAYIAWLSRDTPVGDPVGNAERYEVTLPERSPDVAHGGAIYAAKCATCHQAGGGGINGAFPPLWGPRSFNAGAGMAHIALMTGFVRYNMPRNAPGSLSLAQAYDVSAYVLGHKRPRFNRRSVIVQAARPAGFF